MTNAINEINEMKQKISFFGVEMFHVEKAILSQLEGTVEDSIFYTDLLKEEVYSFVDVEYQYVCISIIDALLLECRKMYFK